ncbi:hypothetical protein K6U06_16630 [Acidiferrimicrobium sp. IK]|uniref:hypothetical protein n=1 Tax=Acidiferrimicrobium sp. IK TaxID=2871700 RepID=UPI0021CAFAD7|nr:hypothetical protein [Acidiferrimicrobium sp. IK]MCU4185997.1 hypothetical protein [Acidiferrimicrobium sp. IK]
MLGLSVGSGLTAAPFVTAPAGAKGPDDITTLGGDIFTAYQNGIGPTGTPAGATSTLVEYHADGAMVASWSLVGKIDGLSSDPASNRLIATVNEDGNSSVYTVHPSAPAGQQVFHMAYSPSTLTWGGGTDQPRMFNGSLYISASAPAFANNTPLANPGGIPALIKVDLSESAGTATWTPAYEAPAGNSAQIASDPDSSNVVPSSVPTFGGDFVLDSQGDGQLYFISNPSGPSATATPLQLGTQIDDIEFATAPAGTLYAVDGKSNRIVAIRSGSFTPGTAFVAVPGDSTVPSFIGTLNLSTGAITPVVVGLTSPSGLLFVPSTNAGPFGYRLTAADGGSFTFGDSSFLGSLGNVKLNKPIVAAATTPDRGGEYLVASDGGVFTFGDAAFHGSLGAAGSPSPVVGAAATTDGYWVVASDGTVTAFGSAPKLGSVPAPPSPVVGITATADGGGYWVTTSDGSVYGFGDAGTFGGLHGTHLNKPIVGIAGTPDNGGYWLVASDGGVFNFGDAQFLGSTGGIHLNKPVVAISATSSGDGYRLVASDGGVFTYGDAGFFGSTGSVALNRPIVAAGS